MEEIVTRQVENGLSGIAGIERIRSRAQEGSTWVSLDFTRGADLAEATNDVRAALDDIWLPPEADPPSIWKFNPDTSPIIIVGVTPEAWDLQELTLLVDRDVSKRFAQLPGVGTVELWGGIYREIKVDLKRDRLNASRLSSADIRAALMDGNVNLPGGNVIEGVQSLYVRTLGEYSDRDQIRSTVVDTDDGRPIRVGDVADVSFGYSDLSRLVKINGKPMLRFGIQKQSGANTVAVSEAVRAEVARITAERGDINLMVVSDQATFIQNSNRQCRSIRRLGRIVCRRYSLPLSAAGSFDFHHRGGDSDFDDRDVWFALFQRTDSQPNELRGLGTRHRSGRGQCSRGSGEHHAHA